MKYDVMFKVQVEAQNKVEAEEKASEKVGDKLYYDVEVEEEWKKII